eukprot:2481709-Rhodomonas_salina.2
METSPSPRTNTGNALLPPPPPDCFAFAGFPFGPGEHEPRLLNMDFDARDCHTRYQVQKKTRTTVGNRQREKELAPFCFFPGDASFAGGFSPSLFRFSPFSGVFAPSFAFLGAAPGQPRRLFSTLPCTVRTQACSRAYHPPPPPRPRASFPSTASSPPKSSHVKFSTAERRSVILC